MSKIAQVKLPKLAPLPQIPPPPKTQMSVQTQIFRSNREAAKVAPMLPQRYPRFMKKAF